MSAAVSESVAGIYSRLAPARSAASTETGIPVFIGYASKSGVTEKRGARSGESLWSKRSAKVDSWAAYRAVFGEPAADSYLAWAVRGFFENGGRQCYILPLDRDRSHDQALSEALDALDETNLADLVCVPDLLASASWSLDAAAASQQFVLDRLSGGHRFAILDSVPQSTLAASVTHWVQVGGEAAKNGALYFPWLKVHNPLDSSEMLVPPCGHIAGVFSRTDRETGPFRAPANQVVEGAYDLEHQLSAADQENDDPAGVINCIRTFPSRGIRVWGAHTLSGESAWRHVAVRRLFLTTTRWLQTTLTDVVMEPNDPKLWARIRREVNAYLFALFNQGALKGNTPQEAFFLKCDAETVSAGSREQGAVVVEIGLAAAAPAEFIIFTFVCDSAGPRLRESGVPTG
jgi:phage tail sheath protein FI